MRMKHRTGEYISLAFQSLTKKNVYLSFHFLFTYIKRLMLSWYVVHLLLHLSVREGDMIYMYNAT